MGTENLRLARGTRPPFGITGGLTGFSDMERRSSVAPSIARLCQ